VNSGLKGVDLGPEVMHSGPEGANSGPEGLDSGPERVDSGPEVVESERCRSTMSMVNNSRVQKSTDVH
jgi:hypothetical protein